LLCLSHLNRAYAIAVRPQHLVDHVHAVVGVHQLAVSHGVQLVKRPGVALEWVGVFGAGVFEERISVLQRCLID
jgi:hypothetical protein